MRRILSDFEHPTLQVIVLPCEIFKKSIFEMMAIL